jgi:hypothetical protein
MKTQDDNRLIAVAASAVLRPLGSFQKGKSRIWLDDRGWWLGVIEFQPGGFSKGSYLNVAACWLWYEKDFLSFDYGDRVESFHPFENVDQFQPTAAHVAKRAGETLLALRSRFANIDSTARVLKDTDRNSIWYNYHAGIAAGLVGDAETTQARFGLVLKQNPSADWIRELHERVHELLGALRNTAKFRSNVAGIIRRSRGLHKLPEAGPLAEEPGQVRF